MRRKQIKSVVNLMSQGIKFFGISGIGWILDFSIFNILGLTGLSYEICNVFSSICGVTFVFFVSTKKTFHVNLRKLTLVQKYFVYILYQIIMIFLASKIVGVISEYLMLSNIGLLCRFAGIAAKICVTPFTMVCNFIFMKILSEKI